MSGTPGRSGFRVDRPRVFWHGVVDSTSERAFAALEAGEARHGDVHVASGQTRGRGRLGRSWESAAEEGLYLSAVLLPGPPPLDPVALTMAAGLAVLEAVRGLGLRARLDWPNDVVVGPAKLAGILVESRGLDPERPHYVVGIGVNVLQRAFPAALTEEREVTSLALEGVPVEPSAALDAILDALGPRLDAVREAPADLCRDFLAATELVGATVRVDAGSGSQVGRLAGIDPDRGLLLEAASGETTALRLAHVRAVLRAESSPEDPGRA